MSDSPAGLLGGTFDPPHIGHLLLAECARVQFGLERVLFIPAGEPYRKTPGRQVTPAQHRVAMTRLALAGNPAFEVDELEVRREGATYTVDTLAELAARGISRPVLILGSDALADMPHWKEPGRIAELSRIVVAAKERVEADIVRLSLAAGLPDTPPIVDMPRLAVSSTEVRRRLSEGLPVRYLVPDSVLEYIEAHRLYRRP